MQEKATNKKKIDMLILVSAIVVIATICFIVLEEADDADAKITYNKNGGTLLRSDGGNGSYEANNRTTVIGGTPVEKEDRWDTVTYVYYRQGYSLAGWSTSNDNNGTFYAIGSQGPNGGTLYAVWTQITFDPSGGTITASDGSSNLTIKSPTANFSTAPDDKFKVSVTTYSRSGSTISDSTTTTGYSLTKDKHALIGWSLTPGSATADYAPGDTLPPSGKENQSYTLYAVWAAITFNPNDGGSISGSDGSTPATLQIPATALSTTPGCIIAPGNVTYIVSKSGCRLLGWSENPSATSATYACGSALPRDQSRTLYAVWEAGVVFDANGGTVTDSNGKTFTYYSISVPSTVTVPGGTIVSDGKTYIYSRDCYRLVGWADTPGATSATYTEGASVTFSSGGKVYAVWSPIVIFDANGGIVQDSAGQIISPHSSLLDSPVYVPGNSFILVSDRYTYSKDGCSFLGWSTDKNATEPVYTEGNILPSGQTGYRLYAVWEKNSYGLTVVYVDKYSITFDPNNGGIRGSDGSRPGYLIAPYANVSKAPGNVFVLGETTYIFTKPGYYFAGWSLTAGDTSNIITPGSALPPAGTTESYSLYAVWSSSEQNLPSVDIKITPFYSVTLSIPYQSRVDLSSYMNYEGMNGYKIVGWSTVPMDLNTKDGNGAYLLQTTGTRYNQYFSMDGSKPVTLYPIWGKIITFPTTGSTATISNGSGCYYATGTSSTRGISFSGGTPKLFVSDLNVTASTANSPLIINNNTTLELTVISDSTFKGYGAIQGQNNNVRTGYAGINVKSGGTLIVSKYSEGLLTAQGGDALNNNNNSCYSGAGIGTNGRTDGNENNCGTIIINGGYILAKGGAAIIDMDYGYYYNTTGAYSGPGIGGRNSTITINAGTVTAATGSIYGKYWSDTSNQNTYTNGTGAQWGTASAPLTPAEGAAGSHTTIDREHAVVYLYDRTGGTVSVSDPVKIKIKPQEDGSAVSIGSAASIIINGTTVTLAEMSIPKEGVIIQIDPSIVTDNNGDLLSSIPIKLLTGYNNYFSGTGTWNGSMYEVTITLDNTIPHAEVKIYINETLATGNEVYCSVTPSTTTTIGANSGDHMLYPFTVSVNEGYVFSTIKIKSGNTWIVHEPDTGLGESRTDSGTFSSVTLYFTISANGTNVTTHHVSFTITPIQHEVTLNCSYSDGAHDFANAMVTSDDNNPSGISWNNNYTEGTHIAYHKTSKTYTIKTLEGDLFRHLQLVTVNGVTVETTDNNDGTFTLELIDIDDDTVINISFRPTVKVTATITIANGSTIKSNASVDITGTDGSYISGKTVTVSSQSGTTVYECYAYVDQNSTAIFTISNYTEDTETGNNLGISSIQVTSGNANYVIANGVEDTYETDFLSNDTTIAIRLTGTEYSVQYISGTTTHTVKYMDGTYIKIPTEHELSGMDSDTADVKMYVKTGYDLLYWEFEGLHIDAGSTAHVTRNLTFTAVWADDGSPHVYTITYVTDGGSQPAATSFTVTSETFSVGQSIRSGYTFAGWSGTGISGTVPDVTIETGSVGDRTYIANWTPITVYVTLSKNTSDPSIVVPDPNPRAFTYGSTYGELPLFPNITGYSFGGWAKDSAGTKRITSSTVVDNSATIYIIWIGADGGLYAVNVLDSEGGEVTLSSITGDENEEIVLTITSDTGHFPSVVKVNGTDVNSDDPSTGFRDYTAGSGSYTLDLKPNQTHLYYVQVIFTPITYDIYITHAQNAETDADFTIKQATLSAYNIAATNLTSLVGEQSADDNAYAAIDTSGITGGVSVTAIGSQTDGFYMLRFVMYKNGMMFSTGNNSIYLKGADQASEALSAIQKMATAFASSSASTIASDFVSSFVPDPANETFSVVSGATVTEATLRENYSCPTVLFAVYNIKSEPVYITKATVGDYAAHTFAGWEGTGINGIESNYITIPKGSTGNRHYEEVWYADSYSITYHENGGINDPRNPSTYRAGSTVVLYEAQMNEHIFVAWCTDEQLTKPILQISSDTIEGYPCNVDLYALFKEGDPLEKPTGLGSVVYDGEQRTCVDNGNGYFVITGTNEATWAGSYTVTVTPKDGYYWAGEVGDARFEPIQLAWQITKRDVYIMSTSGYYLYDGNAHAVGEDSYITLGITKKDLMSSARFSISSNLESVTNVGRYVNTITCSGQSLGSYTFHVYPGTHVVFSEETTTVSIDFGLESSRASQFILSGAIQNAQPGNLLASLPRSRRSS